ncbi:hypothetical protein IRJ41_007803 [Triplophysa rosa]|uniref:Uncharacterized protein n=1 Tax=Triplophysa rosa TaxID=992332 RepID=A0A9W7TQP7_TRIRA|nr:hypothetical protein IRJ41_007803 [Triplophysa rosa]
MATLHKSVEKNKDIYTHLEQLKASLGESPQATVMTHHLLAHVSLEMMPLPLVPLSLSP